MAQIDRGPSYPHVGTVLEGELATLRAGARATGTKARRMNIRLASADVRGLRALALREGISYRTLIASVRHTCVTGRLADRG